MEKLQLASHAIGDIEALLEAAGMNEQNEDGIPFEEMIRQLVIASLAGKDDRCFFSASCRRMRFSTATRLFNNPRG